MLKIAVFGFFAPETGHLAPPGPRARRSPVSADEFMQAVWGMQPPEARIGAPGDVPCFVKLTRLAAQPVYVQLLSEEMAPGAGLLPFDGYIVIIDAVKILAPRAIQRALRRLGDLNPNADVMIAAGRQNEPEALSSDGLREVLGLHADLPIFPYVPAEPGTVHRLVRRLARYVDNPDRVAPPIFAGEQPAPPPDEPPVALPGMPEPDDTPPEPTIHGLAHVAVTVSDLDQSLAFYRGVLGFRVLGHLDYHDERGFTITYLDAGRGVIKLFSFAESGVQPLAPPDDTRLGLQHIALRVTGLDAIIDRLRAAGVTIAREPVAGVSGARIAFFTDPDGTLIELIEGDLVYTRR